MTSAVQPPADAGNLLGGLNDEQRAATVADDPTILIVAGPGSGKTRLIVHRIAYAVHLRGIEPQRIVAVTFTNRAAEEMRARVEGLLGSACGARIGTFHWLCQAILRRQAHRIGWPRDFRLLTPREARVLLRATVRELWPEADAGHEFGAAVGAVKNGMELIQAARAHGVGAEALDRLLPSYDQRLRSLGALDLDDLLAKTLVLLRDHADVRGRMRAAVAELLVDEYQDTNPVQQELLVLLRPASGSLVAVGDEDQAIYSWRQAGEGTVRHFRERFPHAKVIVLDTTYRCTRHILRAASFLIAHNRERMEKQLSTIQPAGSRPVCYAAADERDEAEWIAARVVELASRGPYRYEEIGVLFRTNVQARAIEEALVRHDIPYVVRSGVRFYELPEIRMLVTILRLLLDAGDDDATVHVLASLPGIGERRLAQLQLLATERALSLRALISATDLPFPAAVRSQVAALHEGIGRIESLRRGPTYTVVEAAVELARRFLRERQRLASPDDDPLQEVLAMVAEENPRSLTIRGLIDRMSLSSPGSGPAGISLLTLHAAKGLEFSVVLLAGVEEGLLPHRRGADNPASLEEERRLCYVGMTRAKRLLFISYAQMRLLGGHGSLGGASRFIGEMGRANLVFRSSRQLRHRPRLLHVRPGERVVHPRWQVGTVLRVDGHGRETMVTIDFGPRGKQRVQLCHAPLERLPGEDEHVVAG